MVDYENHKVTSAEDLDEKITDSINYLLLLKGLLVEAGLLPFVVVAMPKKKGR